MTTTPAEDLTLALTRLIDLPGLTEAAGAPLGAGDIAAIIAEAERFAREARTATASGKTLSRWTQ